MYAKPYPSRLQKNQAQKIPRLITKDYLKNSGLYYLGRYSASTAKFKSLMLKKIEKSFSHHQKPTMEDSLKWLEEVIADFIRLGYLNDTLYAKTLSQNLKQKGYSQKILTQKMMLKGVSVENLETDDLKQILKLMKRKKWGVFARDAQKNDYQKLLARLARNGFSFDVCQKALAMSADDIEEYLS